MATDNNNKVTLIQTPLHRHTQRGLAHFNLVGSFTYQLN